MIRSYKLYQVSIVKTNIKFILMVLTWYNLYYRHAATIPNWYSEINVTIYSDFSKDNMTP